MEPKTRHIPGQPDEPCPPELERVASTLRHPLITRCGITCTKCGEWALYLGVAIGTKLPIREIENFGFPVVYVAEPKEPSRIQDNE